MTLTNEQMITVDVKSSEVLLQGVDDSSVTVAIFKDINGAHHSPTMS